MRARKASKPAAADTARELRGNAKLDQLSARKLPRQKCSLQAAVYDARLRLGVVQPRQARDRGARRARAAALASLPTSPAPPTPSGSLLLARWRHDPPPPEQQSRVVDHLAWRAKPDVFAFNVSLGGYRTAEAAILKSIGAVAGIPDIVVVSRGHESGLARRGPWLKRAGRELVGPCPVCDGRDRFGDARVDPSVFAIAKAPHDRRLYPHVVELLQGIDRDHPALSFSGFVTAIHLAYLHDRPGGNA
jgi:hypothetical protein